jgi:PAS domain S-box-containing protein
LTNGEMLDNLGGTQGMDQSLGAQLRTTLNTVPAFTWYSVPSGTLTFVNHRYADYLGLPTDHPLRFGVETGVAWDTHLQLLHPDDHESSRKVGETILRTGGAGETAFRVRDASGVYRWFLSRVEPVRASDGTVLCFIGINLDMEERKRVEEALRRSEHCLAEAQRLSHTGSFGWNVSTDEHFWSDETFRIFEFDPSSRVSLPMILECVHPQDMPAVKEAIAAATRVEGIDLEIRLLMPDGRIKYLHIVGTPEKGNTSAVEIIGAVMDITARTLTEVERRRSRAHLADAQRLSRTGSVGFELSTKRIFWSEESARIYGYPPGTEPTPDLILQRSHPDDVDRLKEVLERAAQGGSDFDWEHRLLMPDGSIKHLHDLAHSSRDEAGNEEIVGAIMDVTERTVAEDTIRRSEAYLAEAQTLSHTGSFGWK